MNNIARSSRQGYIFLPSPPPWAGEVEKKKMNKGKNLEGKMGEKAKKREKKKKRGNKRRIVGNSGKKRENIIILFPYFK